MTKQRGSRSTRGVVRYAKKYVDEVRAQPLPEDRIERAVETARRSWITASYMDMRMPMNKRRAAERSATWERTISHHLTTAHGVEITTERNKFLGGINYLFDGRRVLGAKMADMHEDKHSEAR